MQFSIKISRKSWKSKGGGFFRRGGPPVAKLQKWGPCHLTNSQATNYPDIVPQEKRREVARAAVCVSSHASPRVSRGSSRRKSSPLIGRPLEREGKLPAGCSNLARKREQMNYMQADSRINRSSFSSVALQGCSACTYLSDQTHTLDVTRRDGYIRRVVACVCRFWMPLIKTDQHTQQRAQQAS